MVKHVLQHDELDQVFHALGDPGRRSMVDRLSRGPASVSELAEPLDMSLTAVVQHVRVLERCGLVTTSKRGRVRMCQLHVATLRDAEVWILERRRQWERRLDRLGDIFVAEPGSPDDRSPGPEPTADPTDPEKDR
jgi:DNA-binding transcriptional ArsR family regulator